MRMLAYTRFELVRTVRNIRLLVFSLGFPLVLFLAVAVPARGEQSFAGTGISVPLYYMVGLVSFGTMIALISNGARIASERTNGWTRQLRVTPLSSRAYLSAKVLTGYAMAGLTIAVLYGAGVALGVRLPVERWLAMTGLIVVGLLPFGALGVLLGQLLTADVIGPASGGVVALLALVSGNWYPVSEGASSTTSPSTCRPTGSSRPATSPLAATAGGRPDGRSSPPGRSCSADSRWRRTGVTPSGSEAAVSAMTVPV